MKVKIRRTEEEQWIRKREVVLVRRSNEGLAVPDAVPQQASFYDRLADVPEMQRCWCHISHLHCLIGAPYTRRDKTLGFG